MYGINVGWMEQHTSHYTVTQHSFNPPEMELRVKLVLLYAIGKYLNLHLVNVKKIELLITGNTTP